MRNVFSNRVVPIWNALAAVKKHLDSDPSLDAVTYEYDD